MEQDTTTGTINTIPTCGESRGNGLHSVHATCAPIPRPFLPTVTYPTPMKPPPRLTSPGCRAPQQALRPGKPCDGQVRSGQDGDAAGHAPRPVSADGGQVQRRGGQGSRERRAVAPAA